MYMLESSSFLRVHTLRSVSSRHEIAQFSPVQTSRPVYNN